MTVKCLEQSEYNDWDLFVEKSPQGYVWDYSWWTEILTDGKFRICALIDDDNRIIAGIVLSCPQKGVYCGLNLTQANGILFEDMSKINNMRYQKQLTNQKEYTNLLFDFLEKDFDSFDMKFYYRYDYWLPLYWRGYRQTTRYTYIIDYNNSLQS